MAPSAPTKAHQTGPASGCRSAGWVGQGNEDVFGRGLGGVDAVGDSDTVKGDTRQEEPGYLVSLRLIASTRSRWPRMYWGMARGWRAIRSRAGHRDSDQASHFTGDQVAER